MVVKHNLATRIIYKLTKLFKSSRMAMAFPWKAKMYESENKL